MKKVLFLATALVVLSLSSCKKKTCTDDDGYVWCTDCTKSQVTAAEAIGATCEK